MKVKDKLVTRYNDSFKRVVDRTDNSKLSKEANVFLAPMSFGKTHHLITEWIPYMFETTNVKVQIITAPLKDIIADNMRVLKETGRLHRFEATKDVKEAIQFIEDGVPTVIYLTTKMLFAQNSYAPNKLRELLKETLKFKFAVHDDEFHASTASASSIQDPDGYHKIVGFRGNGKYKASMYKILSEFADYTNYINGMTATSHAEIEGLIDTYGELNYKIANPDDIIKPQEIAHRLAHMGKDVYGEDENSLVDMAIKDMAHITKKTNHKLTAMFMCQDHSDTKDNYTHEVVKDRILSKSKAPKNDYTTVVSLDKNVCLYNKNGDIKEIDDTILFKKANDPNDPLTYIIVNQKMKMGININNLKYCVLLKKSNAKNPDDGTAITFNNIQKYGRFIRPNAGVSNKDFWEKYDGDLSKCPPFPKEINQMNFYIMDTPAQRAAMEEFKRNFAPVGDVYEEVCPMCGQEIDETNLTKHAQNHYNVDINDKITEILDKEFFHA